MPIYFYWGEDDFALTRAVKKLRESVVHRDWFQFNYHRLAEDKTDTTIAALDLAMTPPFGMGERLIEVSNSNICNGCPEDLYSELNRTLAKIPSSSHLLFTSSKKPDKRLKSTKLVQKSGEMREFALIPPWNTKQLLSRVEQVAAQFKVSLTPTATEFLAEAVGNDTRQLWNELEKLSLYGVNHPQPLDEQAVNALVSAQNPNSIKLAAAIKEGDRSLALSLAADLLNRNEPALKICATLVGQFRTWTVVKLMLEEGERDDKAIAAAAGIANFKRLYYLRKEIQFLTREQLLSALPILLELEFSLKRGGEPLATLQTKLIHLCRFFVSSSLEKN